MKLLKKILHFLASPLCEYFAPPLSEGPKGEVRLSEDGFATVELPQGLSITARRVDIGYTKEDSEAAAALVEAIKRGTNYNAQVSVGEQPAEESELMECTETVVFPAYDDDVNLVFIKQCVKALRNTKVKKFKPLKQDFNQSSAGLGFAKGDKIESLSGLGVIVRLLDKKGLVKLELPQRDLHGFVTAHLVRVSDNHDQGVTIFNVLDGATGIEGALDFMEVRTAKGLFKTFIEADRKCTFKQLADGLERRYLK